MSAIARRVPRTIGWKEATRKVSREAAPLKPDAEVAIKPMPRSDDYGVEFLEATGFDAMEELGIARDSLRGHGSW